MSERIRLVLALVAPTVLVALAMFPLSDLRLAFVFYVLGGCMILPFLLLGVRPGGDGLPFSRPEEQLAGFRGAPLAVLLFGPLFLLAYWALRHVITAPEPYLENLARIGWDEERRALFFTLFLIAVPLAEEWWWRGKALPIAERLFSRRAAQWIVALGFASYHAPVLLRLYPTGPAMLRFSGIVVAGFAWTAIAARRRSWGWGWWAHLAADAVVVLAFVLWVSPQA